MPIVRAPYEWETMRVVSRKVTSQELKLALLSYFRYKRQAIVASEVISFGDQGDILADTGTKIIEVEIKVSRSDLRNDFKTKNKYHYLLGRYEIKDQWYIPNEFYFCVPEKLMEYALELIPQYNDRIGIIQYTPRNSYLEEGVFIAKKAKKIKDGYSEKHAKRIIKRLCSEVCILNKEKFNVEHNIKEEHRDQLFFEGML